MQTDLICLINQKKQKIVHLLFKLHNQIFVKLPHFVALKIIFGLVPKVYRSKNTTCMCERQIHDSKDYMYKFCFAVFNGNFQHFH